MTDAPQNDEKGTVCVLGHGQCKRSSDITEGDVLVFFGTPHRVAVVEPYAGPLGGITGIARASDGWGISLSKTTCLEVA